VNRKRSSGAVTVLVLLLASPLWLPALSASPFPERARGRLRDFSEPLLQGGRSFRRGLRDIGIGFLRGPALIAENRALKRQIQTLLAHEETHRELYLENTRLRALIQFRAQAPWKLTPCEVIGREHDLWSRSILLDKGSADGIAVGQAVMTPVGLAGRITQVSPGTSRAMLVTDPSFRVAATVTRLRMTGLAVGHSPGECRLTYLPPDAEVQSGDIVVTAGGVSFCPGGIPIGSITGSDESQADLYRSARFKPAVELSALEEVLVIAWPSADSSR